MLVPDIGDTTRHTGSEVTACLTQHNHTTACHILTTVVTCALDNCDGTRVTYAEALTYLTVDIQLSARSTIESGITCDDVILGIEVRTHGRKDSDTSATESLGEIVVGLTLQFEGDAFRQECSERLTSRALELHVDGLVVQTFLTIFHGYRTSQHGTNGTVGILDGIVEVHLFLSLNGRFRSTDNLLVEHVVQVFGLLGRMIQRGVAFFLAQQSREVENRRFGFYQLRMSYDIVQMFVAHLCEVFTYLLGEEGEVVHQILIASHEVLAQGGILRGNTHRTGVQVTFTHHHTTQYDEDGCSETKLLGTKQCHDDDVTTRLDLSVNL